MCHGVVSVEVGEEERSLRAASAIFSGRRRDSSTGALVLFRGCSQVFCFCIVLSGFRKVLLNKGMKSVMAYHFH